MLPVKIFETTDYPPRPSSGGRRDALTLSRSSSCSPWVACLHLAQRLRFLKAAAGAVRERGWIQGGALGDEQAGHCNWRTAGGSSCPPRQDMLDRLTLLLCSPELLGHVTGCVAEDELCLCPYVNQTQPEVALLDHKCGHCTNQRPCHNLRRFWCEVRYGTELFRNFRIVTTPMHVPQCF